MAYSQEVQALLNRESKNIHSLKWITRCLRHLCTLISKMNGNQLPDWIHKIL